MPRSARIAARSARSLRCGSLRGIRTSTAPAAPTEHASPYRSEFLRTLEWRGFISQATDLAVLDEKLATSSAVAYIGFDATARSLHVGSLTQLMLLRHFQRCGHKPIVLMGGGTTKVGDPSGKDAARQMLDDASIRANMDGLSAVFQRFLSFGDGPTDALLVDNDAWLSKLAYLPFLREYGDAPRVPSSSERAKRIRGCRSPSAARARRPALHGEPHA
jgi:tyrosyl-tRNA synthetase